MKQPAGAWIFVSHSTTDIKAVREIRNTLESYGHHPLLFFLKCIHEEPELEQLLRREMEAREVFLLCDSPAARESRWVRREQDFIRALKDRVIKTLPLDVPSDERDQILRSLSHRASFYLSSSRQNHEFASSLREYLAAHDYAVADWTTTPLNPGEDFAAGLRPQIQFALESGGIILLLAPHAGQSIWNEIADILECYDAAHSPEKRILPFVTHDYPAFVATIPESLRLALTRFRLEDISHLPPPDQQRLILTRIRSNANPPSSP